MQLRSLILPLALICSTPLFGVHAHTIRYNAHCSEDEQKGNLDAVDQYIFASKTPVNYAHMLATPKQLITAKKDLMAVWLASTIDKVGARLSQLEVELQQAENSDLQSVITEAYARLKDIFDYLNNVQYQDVDTELIAVPEQDIAILMQWAQRVVVAGDEMLPLVTIILDGTTTLNVGSCCGELPYVISDHIYWQKLIEAGWVAVDHDASQRVQPILHTSVIGEKFHFYKTNYGVFFRETLADDERTPGDLVRIVKYLAADPRHIESVHGNAHIIWLKFPYEADFTPSLDGQYIPGSNRARTASWVYAHDFAALFTELNNAANNR